MTESLPPKSRLPRTGTLVLIAVVLLIGGGALMVWLPYHRNQTAIAEVEKLGGLPHQRMFVRIGFPLAAFERVITVSLHGDQVISTLERLRGVTN